MSNEWLYPFKGRNSSNHSDQNFLWRNGCIYVMDNHRAALWCWLQEIDSNSSCELIHIDAHYDCLSVDGHEALDNLPDLSKISIHDYLAIKGMDRLIHQETFLIRWDNYIPLAYRILPRTLRKYLFVQPIKFALHQKI